jgi:putative endonuclease
MAGGYVYFLTDHGRRVLYIGVTGNLEARIYEHQQGRSDFSSRYGLIVLVYYEFHEDIRQAIQREKNMKHWTREWKNKLVDDFNPLWSDLSQSFLH